MTGYDDINASFSAAITGVLPVAAWLVLAVTGFVKYERWWLAGLLVPVIISSTLALTWAGIPGRIGWAVSRGDMERAAAACDTLDTSKLGVPHQRVEIGVYTFHHIERETNGACDFHLLRDYPSIQRGFLYLPHGERRNGEYDHTYIPLGDFWYFYHL
ncbi:hypothetical protein ACWFRF_04260 [Nocardia sp. NPDC055165]